MFLFFFSGSVELFPTSNSCVRPVGGAGVHVQPDRRHRRADDAPGLRHRRLGGEPGAHQLPGIHEVWEEVRLNFAPPSRSHVIRVTVHTPAGSMTLSFSTAGSRSCSDWLAAS